MNLLLLSAVLTTLSARPSVLLTFPEPATGLPKALALAERASAKSPRAKIWRTELKSLGLDPLAPGSLTALGADLSKPAYLWLSPGGGAAALELSLGSAERFEQILAGTKKRSKKLSTLPSGGLCVERSGFTFAAERLEQRIFLELSPPKSRCGAFLANAAGMSHPARAPELSGEEQDPTFWLEGDGEGGVERVAGLGFIDGNKLRLRARLGLDMAGALILGGAPFAKTSRPLIQGPGRPAIELSAGLSRSLLASLVDSMKLPPDLVQSLSGQAQLLLSQSGSLIFALEARPEATAEALEAGRKALAEAAPEARLSGRTLLAIWPGKEKLGELKPSSGAAEQTPVLLKVEPRLVLEALILLAEKQPDLELDKAELKSARVEMGGMLGSITALELEARVQDGAPEVTVRAELGGR